MLTHEKLFEPKSFLQPNNKNTRAAGTNNLIMDICDEDGVRIDVGPSVATTLHLIVGNTTVASSF